MTLVVGTVAALLVGVAPAEAMPLFTAGPQDMGAPPVGIMWGSAPAVASWTPGRLDVFVWGNDKHYWHVYSNDGGSNWSGWEDISAGYQFSTAPGAGSDAYGRRYLCGAGLDQVLQCRLFDYRYGWRGWDNWAGSSPPRRPSPPTATTATK